MSIAGRKTRTREFYERMRLAYVNSDISCLALAKQHGISHRTLEKRITREGWAHERRKLATAITMEAQQRLRQNAVEELAKWNEDDIRLARALRAQVARTLNAITKPDDAGNSKLVRSDTLRTLASTAETAQRLARIAMGASNNVNAAPVDADPLAQTFAKVLANLDRSEETSHVAATATPALPSGNGSRH